MVNSRYACSRDHAQGVSTHSRPDKNTLALAEDAVCICVGFCENTTPTIYTPTSADCHGREHPQSTVAMSPGGGVTWH